MEKRLASHDPCAMLWPEDKSLVWDLMVNMHSKWHRFGHDEEYRSFYGATLLWAALPVAVAFRPFAVVPQRSQSQHYLAVLPM